MICKMNDTNNKILIKKKIKQYMQNSEEFRLK